MERVMLEFLEKAKEEASNYSFSVGIAEEGRVISIGDDIAHVSGPGSTKLYELLLFESGDSGIAFDLDRDRIGVVILENQKGIKAGDRVYTAGTVLSVGVGEELLGRVVNPLGYPLDGLPAPHIRAYYPVERDAPSLIQRDYVSQPLYTGIKVIDAMLPIGRGQRELIIGDPSSGKTSIAIDAVINQKRSDVISIYAAIGQKREHILKIIEEIKNYGDISRTVFVVADANESLGLQYIAP